MALFRTLEQEFDHGHRYASVHRARSLYSSDAFVRRLEREYTFEGSTGCVNTVRWSSTGNMIAAAGDDCQIRIWNVARRTLQTQLQSGHTGNIFHAEFVPGTDNASILSCAADGQIRLHCIDREDVKRIWTCNKGMVHKVLVPKRFTGVFYSCSEDGSVRMYDLRVPHSCGENHYCQNILVQVNTNHNKCALDSIDEHPQREELILVSGRNCSAIEYDLRTMSSSSMVNAAAFAKYKQCDLPAQLNESMAGVFAGATDAKYSWSGAEVVVSFAPGKICLFDHAIETQKNNYYRPTPEAGAEASDDDDQPELGEDVLQVEARRLRRVELLRRLVTRRRQARLAREQATSNPSSSQNVPQTQYRALSEWRSRWFQEQQMPNPFSSDRAPPLHECEEVQHCLKVFRGHRSERTVKEINFFGPRSEYIVSGSDDGNIFFWRKEDAEIVQILKGDEDVVNCVQPHPTLPLLLSSGIDYDVKLWSPSSSSCTYPKDADDIIKENQDRISSGGSRIGMMIRAITMYTRNRHDESEVETEDEEEGDENASSESDISDEVTSRNLGADASSASSNN